MTIPLTARPPAALRASEQYAGSLTISRIALSLLLLSPCGGPELEEVGQTTDDIHGRQGSRGEWRRVLLCGTYQAHGYAAWVDVDDDPATNEGNSRLQLVVNDPNIQSWL